MKALLIQKIVESKIAKGMCGRKCCVGSETGFLES
jgi:hypothetical protein